MSRVLNKKGSATPTYNPFSAWYDSINSRLWTGINGSGGGRLAVYTFDGTTFTKVSESITLGSIFQIWYGLYSDGTYVYVGSNTGYLRALAYSAPTLTFVADNGGVSGNIYSLYCDSLHYIYAATSGGLKANSFNGVSFTLRGTVDGTHAISSVTGDGTYLYYADTTSKQIFAATFNGSSFTVAGSYYSGSDPAGFTMGGLFFDGTRLISARYNSTLLISTITAFTFNGSTFTPVGNSYTTAALAYSLTYDGTYYYCAEQGNRIGVYTFDGTNFTLVASLSTSPPVSSSEAIVNGGGYSFICSPPYVLAFRMDLVSQFTADKLSGNAPLTVNFTAL